MKITQDGIDAIAGAMNDALKEPLKQIEALERRMKELEERPTLKYLGVWNESITYEPGQCATHDGSLFHCNTRSKAVRPGDGNVWTLCVKRGRDAR
jgi:hypothetical protein